jgi:hypothetical protein
MSLALITAMLLAPMPPMSSEPFTTAPPPAYGPAGVGDEVREHLYRLYRDVALAQARGEISPAAARDLSLRVERIRRQMVRMGNVVGYRQRVRLRARIDAVRSRLPESLAPGTEGGSS